MQVGTVVGVLVGYVSAIVRVVGQIGNLRSPGVRVVHRVHRLSFKAGLRHSLTSYVARHSWASMAYTSNVDLSVISKALGHTSPKTTLTYIREIDDCRIDEANVAIISQLEGEGAHT